MRLFKALPILLASSQSLVLFAAHAVTPSWEAEDADGARSAFKLVFEGGGFCSASLVGPGTLLTARHCVESPTNGARPALRGVADMAGETVLSSLQKTEYEIAVPPKDPAMQALVPKAEKGMGAVQPDIALIFFAADAARAFQRTPILAVRPNVARMTAKPAHPVVAGFGAGWRLKAGQIVVAPWIEDESYRFADDKERPFFQASWVPAMGQQGVSHTDGGDSGGLVLATVSKTKAVQVGVISEARAFRRTTKGPIERYDEYHVNLSYPPVAKWLKTKLAKRR